MTSFELPKKIYTEADWETMGWHDCKIWTISWDADNLFLDIDYIFKWILNEERGYYDFYIAPATLVFENAYDFYCEDDSLGFIIMSIDKVALYPSKEFEGKQILEWQIELLGGQMELKATGFKQYIRANPKLLTSQHIPFDMRGGISFDMEFKD